MLTPEPETQWQKPDTPVPNPWNQFSKNTSTFSAFHSDGNSKSHFFFLSIHRTLFTTFGTFFITEVCCVHVDGIVLQNAEAKWSIGHTDDSQVQTLVTKLVNYKSAQGAEGELSGFGDEWMAPMQRDVEGEDSQGERRTRRRKAKRKRTRELHLGRRSVPLQ